MTDPGRHHGSIVALVTPVDDAGQVCRRSVERVVEHVCGHVTALMPALSSGEGWLLSDRQWTDVCASTVEHARGLPVLLGIQRPDTASAVARARAAERLGAHGVVVGKPFGTSSPAALLAHYQKVRDAVGLPMVLYHETFVSGGATSLRTLLRVIETVPGVVGVKQSSGSAAFTRALAAASPVPVFEGWENLMYEAAGAQGVIGPLANLEPALVAAMAATPSLPLQREVDEACERFGVLRRNWYATVKQELYRRGLICTPRTMA